MKEYKIPCSWEMYGYMMVEAESLEEAVRKAEEDLPLPKGKYVDGSFVIDEQMLEELNKED